MGLIQDIRELQHHDKLVVIAVVLLLVGAVFMVKDMTAAETVSFVRAEVLDLAILLLVADLIIHLGAIEAKVLAKEREILEEEKKLEKAVFKKKK